MGSKTRPLLIYSTGGLLLLTAITGVAALIAVDHVRDSEGTLRARYLERTERLERIRNSIYLSGTLARDYFVEPEGADAPALLNRLARLQSESKQAADREAGNLRGEVAAYWKVLDLMTEIAGRRRTAGVDAYFRRQLAQRRETMLSIADEVAAEQGREWKRSAAELAAVYRRLLWMLAAELALVVILGASGSIATVRRLVRLERDTRALGAQLVRVQEEERRSISRELHDEVGQALSGLLLEAGKAASILDAEREGEGRAREHLRSVATLAERTVDEVRRIALALRPSMLDDLGLAAALEWQAREVCHRTGLKVEVQAADSAAGLPDAHRTCIYRVAQEALQNCARHAGASRVTVALERDAATVSLRVEDDGKGFQPARTRGLGLLGMEERVAQLGGTFRVASNPGRGTVVMAELPV